MAANSLKATLPVFKVRKCHESPSWTWTENEGEKNFPALCAEWSALHTSISLPCQRHHSDLSAAPPLESFRWPCGNPDMTLRPEEIASILPDCKGINGGLSHQTCGLVTMIWWWHHAQPLNRPNDKTGSTPHKLLINLFKMPSWGCICPPPTNF